ncbi:MAG: GerMN domain-containing protein [Kineothrix sp.]|nr:GerMN domain-containing protein [Lachnospiraceae bacterium]MCX4343964.1 GerMN domain-containing protein [Kineothrix sp.]
MKKSGLLVCLLLSLFFAVSCGSAEEADRSRVYNIYVMNKDETKLSANEYEVKGGSQEEVIDELLEQLTTTPERMEYKAPLSGSFELLGYSLDGGQLVLNFDERYRTLPPTTEVLARAATVRTMTQVKGIDYVSFQIRSNPLLDMSGNVIGSMSADMFIDNTESEMNSRERVKIRLYFANAEGDRLIETNRTLEYSRYSTNISMERLVVEQLIGGPSEQVKDKVYPTMNPETKVIGVTLKDGTCYVNLSEHFLTQIYNVSSDVAIYSLVNTLVELPNVGRVQIAVNGDSNVMFRENTSLSATYERNLDLVTTVQQGGN